MEDKRNIQNSYSISFIINIECFFFMTAALNSEINRDTYKISHMYLFRK